MSNFPREEFETDVSYKLRLEFIKQFLSSIKSKKNRKITFIEANVFSKIYRNIVLLNCSYSKNVEKKIRKISKNNNK